MKENKFKKWLIDGDRKELKEKKKIIQNLYRFGLTTHYINIILIFCCCVGFIFNFNTFLFICSFLLWFNSWVFLVKVENYANK